MSLNLTPLGKGVDQIVNAENDANGNPIFVGWAKPGSADADTSWLIAHLTYDANNALLTLRVANGIFEYNQRWTDRAGLSYS